MGNTSYTIDYLLKNSKLPGPRGNLELLYDFVKTTDLETVTLCLGFIKTDTGNSPEEFVGMCGVLGYAVYFRNSNKHVVEFLRRYASFHSWRIREAVAMGIQEISGKDIELTLQNIRPMISGNSYEQRAVVAGLCEPKLLKDRNINIKILEILEAITANLNHDNKLTDSEVSLRKALGYGWSVVIAASPEEGKHYFERLFNLPGKHIQWIIRNNLKKNRLIKTDKEWVEECMKRLALNSS
ncbi:MAG: hypothetical protein JXA25_09475 [Anaerolineales bacterium]|nr:hypothetical protein [Anaerolineales bacterium]